MFSLFAFFVLAELWAIGVLGGVCMELPRAKTVPVGGRTGELEQAPLRRVQTVPGPLDRFKVLKAKRAEREAAKVATQVARVAAINEEIGKKKFVGVAGNTVVQLISLERIFRRLVGTYGEKIGITMDAPPTDEHWRELSNFFTRGARAGAK